MDRCLDNAMIAMMVYPVLLLLIASVSAVFLPNSRSYVPLNVSNYDRYPSRSSSTLKRSSSYFEVKPQKHPILAPNDAYDRPESEGPSEEDVAPRRRGDSDSRPPSVSRMPSFYR